MKFPFELLILELTHLRTGLAYSSKSNQRAYCQGLIVGYINGSKATYDQNKKLHQLLENCSEHFEKPFPCAANAGPQMPNWM